MKIDLTITRNEIKEHLEIDIPTSWLQVTFRQFCGLADCKGDLIKIVALFTKLDEELIRKAQIHNLNHVTACLSFLTSELKYVVPSTILGIKIPTNLETESIAQYSDLQTVIGSFKQEDSRFNYSQFPLIVATYAVDPYDFEKAEKMQNIFYDAPCTEVLAVGNFTLAKLGALSQGILPTCPQGDTLVNRLRLALGDWLKNLVSILRYYLWKRSLPLNERNFLNGR